MPPRFCTTTPTKGEKTTRTNRISNDYSNVRYVLYEYVHHILKIFFFMQTKIGFFFFSLFCYFCRDYDSGRNDVANYPLQCHHHPKYLGCVPELVLIELGNLHLAQSRGLYDPSQLKIKENKTSY